MLRITAILVVGVIAGIVDGHFSLAIGFPAETAANSYTTLGLVCGVLCVLALTGSFIRGKTVEEDEGNLRFALYSGAFGLATSTASLTIIAQAGIDTRIGFFFDAAVALACAVIPFAIESGNRTQANAKPVGIDSAGAFESMFAFSSLLIGQRRYKKEALIKLAMIAKKVAEEGESLQDYPDNGLMRRKYDAAMSEYAAALTILGEFDEALASQVPHWSELPQFLKGWLKGEPLQDEPAKSGQEGSGATTLALAPPAQA